MLRRSEGHAFPSLSDDEVGGIPSAMREQPSRKAASVGNRAPPHGGGGSGGVLPLRATTTAVDSKRDARAASKKGVTLAVNLQLLQNVPGWLYELGRGVGNRGVVEA